MTTTSTISFRELISGSEGVSVTDDAPQLIWAVDLVMAIKGGTRSHAARDLRDIPDAMFSKQKLVRKNMPGPGNSNTALVPFEHALELVMVLPGAMAKAFRVKAWDMLKCYLAGDGSLVREIEANAASDAPIHVVARESLKRSGGDLEIDEHSKRLAIELEECSHALQERTVAHQQNIMQIYRTLCPGGIIDDRANILFRDSMLTLMGSRPALENDLNPEGNWCRGLNTHHNGQWKHDYHKHHIIQGAHFWL